MSVILFIIVLAVLIFAHELGHFLAAKGAGIRVDEFSIGFPPRIAKWKPKKSETQYSVGAVPLGGYVKIFGEDPDEESISGPDSERSFVNKPKVVQAWVLVAGVLFNLLLAWLLIAVGFMAGLPTSVELAGERGVENPALTVVSVLPDSPADEAGLASGDRLLSLVSGEDELVGTPIEVSAAQGFIAEHAGAPIEIRYEHAGEEKETRVVPKEGIIDEQPAIGVGLGVVGILRLPPHVAIAEGARTTVQLTGATAVGLWNFITDAVTGGADLSAVTGPVGIVGLVGDAAELGFVNVLAFTAFISINLALINLIPVPALDGGRILFVIIEAVKGSTIKPKIANALNMTGFVLLILLMLVVTFNDIIRLVG